MFTKAVAPEVGSFEILVDNNNSYYTNRYSGGEDVEFQYDFSTGSTRRFLGRLEEVDDVFGDGGSRMRIVGSHVGGELLDRAVNKSYGGALDCGDVIKDLIDNFAPSGFTTSNVGTSTISPKITFNGVPLWKAMVEVAKRAKNFDLYVDDSKDVHFFKEGSIENDNEAVVYDDNMMALNGLGKDELDIRNKIRVHGERDGLPVLYTAKDTASQAAHGIRERVIKDTDVESESEAEDLAEGLMASQKNKFDKGSGKSLLLATLDPGDFSFISGSPDQNILGRFRFVKFSHMVPDEMTNFEVEDVRT